MKISYQMLVINSVCILPLFGIYSKGQIWSAAPLAIILVGMIFLFRKTMLNFSLLFIFLLFSIVIFLSVDSSSLHLIVMLAAFHIVSLTNIIEFQPHDIKYFLVIIILSGLALIFVNYQVGMGSSQYQRSVYGYSYLAQSYLIGSPAQAATYLFTLAIVIVHRYERLHILIFGLLSVAIYYTYNRLTLIAYILFGTFNHAQKFKIFHAQFYTVILISFLAINATILKDVIDIIFERSERVLQSLVIYSDTTSDLATTLLYTQVGASSASIYIFMLIFLCLYLLIKFKFRSIPLIFVNLIIFKNVGRVIDPLALCCLFSALICAQSQMKRAPLSQKWAFKN